MMLSVLREKYWVIGANALARKITNRCVQCRKYRGKTMEQMMANLPADRVTSGQAAFTRVGMDFFGPIEVKQRRSTVKKYGVVFVCLSSKAIHIEIASSLDTNACINAIRRFTARRGPVKQIRSDNGTNLVGACREMSKEIKAWNQARIYETLLQKDIDWVFNPPTGSHHGGIWERQIRTIRQIIYALVQSQTLTDDTLHTFICEVENIVNNRPITSNQEDVNDLKPLTPNQLILLKGDVNLPPCNSENKSNYFRRRWKQAQYLADRFWERWKSEYLPLLQRRQKWLSPRRNAKIGDIVLLISEKTPRNVADG
ncbi:uncharacterized protein [Antedon mediterranea]|uniref:uncharacterized protein n=1 Tax=Antedon mediterranea TaxID=105859 RepID=UPI003AF8923F